MSDKQIFFKRTVLILLLGGCSICGFSQIVYNQSASTIDGSPITLSSYQGKKLLSIIAPVKKIDSSKLNEIAAFVNKYQDSIKVIGVMSIEDGYADSNKISVKSMYQNKGINIVLTSGMYTKKAAAINQADLMKFLTTETLNKRFNEDAEGIGQMFFVNEIGKLYSVLVPQTPLLSPAVFRNIQRRL